MTNMKNHPVIRMLDTPLQTIQVDVIFGSPGLNCSGVGICRVIPTSATRVHWKCPHASALLGRTPAGSLYLSFDRRALPQEYVETYFSDDIFEVIEPYSFPSSLVSDLGFSFYRIQSGRYDVEINGFEMIVKI
jgi:hypothetical protein